MWRINFVVVPFLSNVFAILTPQKANELEQIETVPL